MWSRLSPRPRPGRRRAVVASMGAAALAAVALAAVASTASGGTPVSGDPDADARGQLVSSRPDARNPDVRHLTFRYGPIHVQPGQNLNEVVTGGIPGPPEPGFITRFRYQLVTAAGTVPPVSVLHFHHGVWSDGEIEFAGGEEKSVLALPAGYGWPTDPQTPWALNHMIHNLYGSQVDAYLVWRMDFVPAGTPTARHLRPVRTLWMDVQAGRHYPVFNALRGSGSGGRLIYPDERPHAYGAGPARNRVTAPFDGVLVYAFGHLHPGGLYTDLRLTRGRRTTRIFRSRAHYYDPRGPVSWDMAMEATPPDWRVQVRRGDTLSISATYATRRASWYEAMGIMPVSFVAGHGGVDPFSPRLDRRGRLTHGRLPENVDAAVRPNAFPDPRRLPAGPTLASGAVVHIHDFAYSQGGLGAPGRTRRPPVVRAGQSIRFVNDDASRNIFHTITSCRLPCNGSPGIGYPLADEGPARFDSGELGFGPPGWTAAANRVAWETPRDLKPGLYAYFCRIHPFMRGAFRVVRAPRGKP